MQQDRRRLLPLLSFSLLLLFLTACSHSRPRLHAAMVDTVPKPSRLIKTKSVWSKAKPITVNCFRTGTAQKAAWPVQLRAVTDGRAISFLAVWHDATGSEGGMNWNWDATSHKYKRTERSSESEDRLSWVWNADARKYFRIERPTDFFALKFCISGAEDACMMTGGEGTYDIWEWRAGWSHVSGYADDRLLKITRERPATGSAQAYPYESGDNKGFVYFQWEDDAGTLPYEIAPRPKEHRHPVELGIIAHPPAGSAGDILAEAVFQKTSEWNLEMYRLLETGNDDDYQLKGRGPHRLSIALSDGQEGANHFASELIDLVID